MPVCVCVRVFVCVVWASFPDLNKMMKLTCEMRKSRKTTLQFTHFVGARRHGQRGEEASPPAHASGVNVFYDE